MKTLLLVLLLGLPAKIWAEDLDNCALWNRMSFEHKLVYFAGYIGGILMALSFAKISNDQFDHTYGILLPSQLNRGDLIRRSMVFAKRISRNLSCRNVRYHYCVYRKISASRYTE